MRQNKWTRVIERVAEQNAAEGKSAGRMLEQFGSATPLISAARVRGMSAAEARRTDFVPEPDDPRAAMMANARAAALGISNDLIPQAGDDLPDDIGHVAGEPTDAEIDAMLVAAKGNALPGVQSAAERAATPGAAHGGTRAAGRVALPHGQSAPAMGLSGPRSMPNFSNVEGFDLTRKVAVVDGMEFKLADDDVVAMKKFAIQVVLDNVTIQLAQALIALGIPQEMAQATADKMRETAAGATSGGVDERGADGATKAVLSVSGVQAVEGVQSGSNAEGRPQVQLSDLPTSERRELHQVSEGKNDGLSAQSDNQGNSKPVEETRNNIRPTDDLGYLLGDGDITPS